ncbi:sigma factor-like helix-turn-helix DNA-binding protein [Bacillus sp. FJAT-27445]|uniref:sigma factor-like helix-turn-helix DNA-binding protein n=1 Tax=Bacillus sp. FJAT-27445 TaxID=1679166 RepID=UPI0007444825|nr:sigma factor-like helix-turn-helix DNA-binding protein [Bacillus sp. FJAT-27445]
MVASKNTPAEEKFFVEIEEERLQRLCDSLQKYCRFLAKDHWEADDLFQAAVLKGMEHYSPCQLSTPLLKKIAYHHWIDLARKGRHEIVGVPVDAAEKERGLIDGRLDAVKVLLEKLTPKQAVMFLLKEGFRYQASEIADLMDTSEMAVKSLLHRAKNRLEKERHLHAVAPLQLDEDKELMEELFSEALEQGDPAILLKNLPKIPSLAEFRKPAPQKHSRSSLEFYCVAA